MLQQSNGSDLPEYSHAFSIDDISQVGEARRYAALICEKLKFDDVRRARVGIVINELGNNLVKYAPGGKLIFRIIQEEALYAFETLSVDSGAGIENSSLAMTDGFTTGVTPGTGLGAVRRQSDVFDLYSVKGQGTLVLSIVYNQDLQVRDRSLPYEVGAICLPIDGETVCGDGWNLQSHNSGLCLMVADGLGHGPQAHQASSEAVSEFQRSYRQPQEQLVKNVHGRLKSTRGAAIFLICSENGSEIEFSGVGNIRAFLQSSERAKNMISQNGTAGLQIRTVKPLRIPWDSYSLLIVHSDGITSRWDLSQYPGLVQHHPAIVAGVAYRDFSRGNDDLTVVAVRKRR